MKSIHEIHGRGIFVKGDDIDTDQIIPARFMKVVTFDDLGQYAFYDARYEENGQPKHHPFNNEKYKGASILVVNRNFGCGSSREHAPQALMRFGIKAIIGESYAEIFAGNCIANGIPVVIAQHEDIATLTDFIEEDPGCEITIDLVNNTVEYGDFSCEVEQNDSHRKSLIEGSWDTLTEMLSNSEKVESVRNTLPYLNL